MKMRSFFVLFTALSVLFGSMTAKAIDIIPLPAKMVETDNKVLKLSEHTHVAVQAGSQTDAISAMAARQFNDLRQATGSDFTFSKASGKALTLKEVSDMGPEAYNLDIDSKGITLTASSATGFFYGLKTLEQIALTANGRGELPYVTIADEPRFGWRGFMLDEGRHFFGKDEVKKILDLMAFYKMNRFHWHLTEDQGWRLEIKKWPRLTEVGSVRPANVLGWQEVEPDSVMHTGFYTQDDVREIVAYAKDRFIEIVPEIDIPGHTQAAVAAYPEILACDPDSVHEVWRYQGVSPDVMNVANPAAIALTEDILDEVVELFPFHYIHLGGDECPTDKWQANQQCTDRLAQLGSEDFRDLQLDYYQTLARHLAANPKSTDTKLIFWNEALHGNPRLLPENATIMSWVDADNQGVVAAQRGLDVILSPQIPYYINRRQDPGENEPRSQGHGTETVERVYNYNPFAIVDPSLTGRYLGLQANFWTEWVDTPQVLEYLMMPRLAAVAEAAWTPQDLRNYDGFVTRISGQRPILDSRNWQYGRHIFK